MDWDDDKFDRADFTAHFEDLGILSKHTVDELLQRTTKNTRTGAEFGFKPTNLSVGSIVHSQFYCGFQTKVDREGTNIQTNEPLASSFWIRFREEWFQIRAICSGCYSLTYNPYECRIRFRDVIPGGIKLRARYRRDCDRVTAELSITSRRPARYTHYLDRVLSIGKDAIFDRHGTEADFLEQPTAELEAGVIHTVEDPERAINLGLWTTHRLRLDLTARQYKLLWMCMVRLRMINLYPDFQDATAVEPPPTFMPRWSSFEYLMVNETFTIRYLVEALLSHCKVLLPEVPDLFRALSRMPASRRSTALEGLFMWTRRHTIAMDLKEVIRRVSPPTVSREHLAITRRCLVTPTRCVLMPPAEETSNSLLRRYKCYVDRFLRVQFVDDDGDFPVRGETLVIDDKLQGREGVFARIRRALAYGLQVAGRHYIFLTFSESQVRERGCWMIAETGEFTVENVLRSMGDLTRERVVAKHAARQSLALSTTRAVTLDVKITRGYPDVKRNGYIFTDGAGHFTQMLADECARVLNYTSTPISAVQCRDGGVKGVLSVVQDPRLADFEIRERDSMIKVYSEDHNFCILKAATYSKATLNRQAILLMESLGVPTKTLLEFLRAEKRSIEGLEDSFAPERLAIVTVFPLKQAFTHHVADDPFVDAVTSLVKCRLLSELKWKAWIEIQDSAFLMGVPDETDSLSEGEVFCQIHPPHGKPQVITGQCVIYRNPCLHPGDVRVVKAVDCPSLRHLRNVIVFNVRGERDLPNMLSGGDLDGDMYSLIWDPRLLIEEDRVYDPMDYTAPTPERCSSPITIDQTKEHFVDFIKNDVLGRVCNTHMALADQYGPDDDGCIELAKLASKAVDFGKTGVRVSQLEIPRVMEYPDFMGKASNICVPTCVV
ncbi:RdRP-domain-containing protein [Cytidiella melzeri]|nr:RdRP-domain-containing protein [Cytidiella melzeri]